MFAGLLKSRRIRFSFISGIFLIIFLLGAQSSTWSQGVLNFYPDITYSYYPWLTNFFPFQVPAPDFDSLHYKRILSFSENNAQGIAFAYNDIWFLSSCDKIFKYSISGSDPYYPSSTRRIKSISRSEMIQKIGLNPCCYNHIGDIDFYEGMLFVPVRARYDNMCHLLIVLDVNLDLVGYSFLPLYVDDAWCAVNPWNGYLYTGRRGENRYVLANDISNYLALFPNRSQWGSCVRLPYAGAFWFYKEDGVTIDSVGSIQGITYSENGQMYITRYNGDGPWYNYIRVYNAFTGVCLGRSQEYNFPDFWDEIEGLDYHPSGTFLVAVAINQNIYTDRFEVYAFSSKSYGTSGGGGGGNSDSTFFLL